MVLDRNKRNVHAHESLSWVMWLGIGGGGLITVAFTFFLCMEKTWPHVVGVSVMAAMIGLLLFIAAMLSRPFHGPLAITPEPFETSLRVFQQSNQGK